MTDIQTMIGMLTPFPDTVPSHEQRLYTCGFMREVAAKLAELSNKHTAYTPNEPVFTAWDLCVEKPTQNREAYQGIAPAFQGIPPKTSSD